MNDPRPGDRVVVVGPSVNRGRRGFVTEYQPPYPHPDPGRIKPGDPPPMIPGLAFVKLDGDWWNHPYYQDEIAPESP